VGTRRLDFGLQGETTRNLEVVLKTGLIELKAKKFDWRRPADALEAILKSGDSATVLLIDELPLLSAASSPGSVRNPAERFLLWLKRLREQYRPRWFFAGSIGLDSVARRLKLSGTIHRPATDRTRRIQPREGPRLSDGRGHSTSGY